MNPRSAPNDIRDSYLINIVLNLMFIPKNGLLSTFGIMGPLGAAVALVISSFAGFIGLKFKVKKLTGIHLLQNHTPRHIIAGIVMGLLLYLFASYWTFPGYSLVSSLPFFRIWFNNLSWDIIYISGVYKKRSPFFLRFIKSQGNV